MNRTDQYRLEALVELGWAYPAAVSVAEIARRRCIPRAYLSQLIGELTRAGRLTTRRGPGGGVALADAPEATRLDLLLSLDCSPASGSPGVHRLGEIIAGDVRKTLGRLTLAELVTWERQALSQPEYVI